MNPRLRSVLAGLGVAVLATACGGGGSPTSTPAPTATPGPLAGGVVAEFDVTGERFKVWVTNAETIQQLFALQAGESTASIPNGELLTGPGQGDHNLPWSWHLDPEEIAMADLTIEVCDGALGYIEEHLDEFIDEVGRYCPWGAELVGLTDHR